MDVNLIAQIIGDISPVVYLFAFSLILLYKIAVTLKLTKLDTGKGGIVTSFFKKVVLYIGNIDITPSK